MKYRLLSLVTAGVFLAAGAANDRIEPLGREPQKASSEGRDREFARHLASAIHVLEVGYVTPTTDAQMVQWAVEGLYKEVKKPVPADIAKRLTKLDKANKEDLLVLLQDARASLCQRKDLEENEDVEIWLRAIFAELEPGARPEDRSCSFHHVFGCFLPAYNRAGEIGLSIKTDPDTGMLRVITPVFNGPAYKAGIRGGDLITHIRMNTDPFGEPYFEPRVISTKGMSIADAEALFSGESGTKVILTVIPAGSKDAKED